MFKKIIKWFIIVLTSFVLLILISLVCFKLFFSQGKIETFEVNNPDFEKHILIASQGSKFKNQLNQILLDEFISKNIYIKVIDVSLLKNIKSFDWESIVIINSIKASKMEKNVVQFIKENYSKNNIVLVNTSGSGNFKIKDYDAISTASSMKNLNNIKQLIIDRINSMI